MICRSALFSFHRSSPDRENANTTMLNVLQSTFSLNRGCWSKKYKIPKFEGSQTGGKVESQERDLELE